VLRGKSYAPWRRKAKNFDVSFAFCLSQYRTASFMLTTTRNVYWSRASDQYTFRVVGLCVPVSVRGRMPTLLYGPGRNLGEW